MQTLNKTKAQLDSLGYPFIGVELKSGGKIFGKIDHFTLHTIYIRNKEGDVIDVPRRIIERAFLLIEGAKLDESEKFFKQNKSTFGK